MVQLQLMSVCSEYPAFCEWCLACGCTIDVGMHTSVSALHSALPATLSNCKWEKGSLTPEKCVSHHHRCSHFLILSPSPFHYFSLFGCDEFKHKGTMAALKCYLTWMHSLAVRKGDLLFFCFSVCISFGLQN